MDATCATTTLRAAGLDAQHEGDAILVSCTWSPDVVTTVPVHGDYVDQWRIEDALRIVWHYTATNERRTFEVSYVFRGLAVAYDDVFHCYVPDALAEIAAALLRLHRPVRRVEHPSRRHAGPMETVRSSRHAEETAPTEP